MGKRERKWRKLEEMYGYPIANVLQWFRQYPLRYKDMAEIFEINTKTLRGWRVALDILPVGHDDIVYYPFPDTPTDQKARALSYEDAQDAVIDIRLRQGKTRACAAKVLEVHPITISQYTPDNLKGLLHNMSKEGREVLSRLRIENNRRHPPSRDHPWRSGR